MVEFLTALVLIVLAIPFILLGLAMLGALVLVVLAPIALVVRQFMPDEED